MEWNNTFLGAIRILSRYVRALLSWEVFKLRRMYSNRTPILFQENTFLEVTKSFIKYYTTFELQYCFHLVHDSSKDI